MLKIAVFAPMPSASVKIAITLKPGCFRSMRKADRISWFTSLELESSSRLTLRDCVRPRRFGNSPVVNAWRLNVDRALRECPDQQDGAQDEGDINVLLQAFRVVSLRKCTNRA